MAGKKNKSAAKREAARRAAQVLRREERTRRRAPSRSDKSPNFSPKTGKAPGPGRVFLFFAAVFALVLLLESERFAVFMDSLAPSPLAENSANLARSLGKISGLAGLTAQEDALILALADKRKIGDEKAAPGPPAASDPPAVSFPVAAAPPPPPSGQAPEVLPRGAEDAQALLEPAPEAPAPDLHPEKDMALRAETALKTPEPQAGETGAPAEAPSPGQKPKASARTGASSRDAPGKRAAFASTPRSLPAPPSVSGNAQKGEKVVLMVGDSMMGWGLGHVLERALNHRPGIRAVRDTRPSTGLASANPFNWQGHLSELVTRHSPDLVVICMGANDGCTIVDQAKKRHVVGTSSWDDAYRQRAGNFLRIAQSGGAKVIWLGLPIVGAERFSGILRRVSLLQQAACAENGQALFIDNYLALADSEGRYSTFLTNRSNKPVRVRAKDKIHITTEGGGILTEFVMPAILNALAPLPPLAAAR
ncbi:MAG: DUF459 domain-containing protein [Desulfovibrio sp.]|jgi:hypothetical protein|nr:DUF459 domain-containing protein [Desulfovibrio sp.]